MDLDRLEKFARSYADISAEFDALNQELWGGNAPNEPASEPLPSTEQKTGFEIPGYTRVTETVDQPLQQKALQLLPLVAKKPYGTGIPFTDQRTGQEYLAVHEEHPPRPGGPQTYHSGVSLFVSNRKPPSPLQMFQSQFGGQELSDRTKSMIGQLDPMFRQQISELMARATAMGLRPEIVEAYRPQERQDQLYEQGRTIPGQQVTNTRNSMHTKRLAVDIYQRDENGKIDLSPEPGFYQVMGQLAAGLGINWGGTWPKPDLPHFQWRA